MQIILLCKKAFKAQERIKWLKVDSYCFFNDFVLLLLLDRVCLSQKLNGRVNKIW